MTDAEIAEMYRKAYYHLFDRIITAINNLNNGEDCRKMLTNTLEEAETLIKANVLK